MEKLGFTKFWLIITAVFLLVILFLIAWFVSLEATEQDVFDRYNQQQLLLVRGVAGSIEGLFDDLAAGLGSLASLPDIQYFNEPATRRELAQKLEELAPQGIADIGILDSDGIARFYAMEQQSEGVDYAWRSYFKIAREVSLDNAADTFIIELQTIDQGEAGFRIAIPIFETAAHDDHLNPGGDFAGVILGSLTLDTLIERHIALFKPPGDGHIFLVNEALDVIWSSDDSLIRANLLGQGQFSFRSMVDRMTAWTHDSAKGDAYTFTNPSRRNEIKLIAFAPVKIGGTLMAIGVSTPGDIAKQTSLANYQGQQLVFILSVLTILAGVLLGAFVLRRETRRRFQIEEALRDSQTEQAILSERNRLASDLHDSVTQGLYGIVMYADAAMGQISSGGTEDAKGYLEEIKAAGKEGLAEMRLLIFELRPPVLEKEGLATAIETRLYAVERRAGLTADFHSEIEDDLPKEIEAGLYHIAQEALNNTIKHAQAHHIQVHLRQVGRLVTLEVMDDGRGFDLEVARQGGGIGLKGMSERVAKMDGKLTIETKPGCGTCIMVEVEV